LPSGNAPGSEAARACRVDGGGLNSGGIARRAPVRAVHIDAIVTDLHGRPILNLRPADFEIFENGVQQKIDGVELKSRSSALASTERIDSAIEEERAAREPGTRLIALYLDEFHVSAGASSEYLRQTVLRFLDEQLRPGDLFIVMKPLDNVTTIRFTRDRDAARQAVSTFSGRKDDYTPRTAFEQQYMGRSPAAVRAARAQIVISGLRALTMRMGELEAGRAALILLSEGFTADVPRTRERRLPDMQGSRVRPVDHRRVLPVRSGRRPDPQYRRMMRSKVDERRCGTWLCKLEAKRSVRDRIWRLPCSASRDLDLLRPDVPPLTRRGRFYDVKIGSSRRDAQVRARTGCWAPFEASSPSRGRRTRPSRRCARLRASPLIESWVGVTVEPDGSRRVTFTWTPSSTTSPARTKPGVRAEVVKLTVSTVKGSSLFDGEVAPVRVGSASGQRIDSAVFAAPPGRIQLDLIILKSDGTRLDTAMQDVDLPDLAGPGPIILPLQLFRAGSARDFREISGNPQASPTPLRSFRRTDRLLLRVPVHPFESTSVTVAVKNRVGQVLRELEPMKPDALRLAQFDLAGWPGSRPVMRVRADRYQRVGHGPSADPVPDYGLTDGRLLRSVVRSNPLLLFLVCLAILRLVRRPGGWHLRPKVPATWVPIVLFLVTAAGYVCTTTYFDHVEPSVPILILSAYGFEWEAELLGAQGYIPKSVGMEEILERVRKAAGPPPMRH
jgi:VWFA-related protein